jgi:leishmanolysin-like peptidase
LYEFKFSIATGVFFVLTDLLLFAAFIRLQTYQWSDRVIKTFVRKNWLVKAGVMKREVNMIVTKNVVREVRDYFNCEDLEGAELEDQGEEGTALTHWEKRVFEVEFLKVM